jgi:hypothetical protein
MKLSNPFSEETRLLFLYETACWDCGRCNNGLELHHNYGRISGSPLNAVLLCHTCHERIQKTQEQRHEHLRKSIRFLQVQGYTLTKKDDLFLELIKNDLRGFM